MRTVQPSVPLTTRVEPELAEAVAEAAHQAGRSVARFVAETLRARVAPSPELEGARHAG